MQNTQSLCIRFLLLITGGLTQCMALKQFSVMQGDTLTLTCPLKDTNKSDAVEWRNPEGLLLFFNRHKVLKDKRSEFVTLTNSRSSIRVTDITFKNGGVYKCLRYNNQVSTKRYKVIVIGAPKLEKYEQEDNTIVKCSASANEHPPRLSWLMENGLEIEAHPYYESENASKKYTAVSQLKVKTPTKRITVRCLVRHSALYGSKLENFIHLGNQSPETSTSSKYSRTTTHGSIDTTVIPTLFSSTSFTDSASESETTDYSNTTVNETTEGTSSHGITDVLSNTTANETTKSISETTEDTSSNTSIEPSSNTTGNDSMNSNPRLAKKGNSPLLVLLVTCLLICLFVVLAFFLVRLRKAHIAWKKENEESDQSVESSRSKSSSEEKHKQQQRGRGFWNNSFTKYKAEEAVENEAQATPPSVQVINENPQHFISRSGIKETEL